MPELVTHNCSRSFILYKNSSTRCYHCFIVETDVKWHRIHEAGVIYVVLLHCSFIPNFINGLIVDVTERSKFNNLLMFYRCFRKIFFSKVKISYKWSFLSDVSKFFQRVSPLRVAKNTTVIPNFFLNSKRRSEQFFIVTHARTHARTFYHFFSFYQYKKFFSHPFL